MNVVVGLLVASAMVGFPPQRFGQNPHAAGGVGAEGLIGRGTIPAERPSVLELPPVQLAPVYAAAPVAATAVAPNLSASTMTSTPRAADLASPSAVSSAGPRRRAEPAPARQPARTRINPYASFDRGWLHGYWTLPMDRPAVAATSGRTEGWSPVSGARPGLGAGWGLAAWVIGPMVYRWGYFSYGNPFRQAEPLAGPGASPACDDSRPVDVMTPPPVDGPLLEGLQAFRAAREAFRREDYTSALRLADRAIGLLPNDPSIHQFRGLTLLAMHRYREAAAALHAVIAVVPGWDWTTLVHLYGDSQTYTRQLRLLESYCERNPRAAAAHFLLAVQYLTTGYPDAAVDELRAAAAIEPGDSLIARLIRALRPTRPASAATVATGSEPLCHLEGTWTARPRGDTTITVIIQPHGHLVWRVSERGQVREFRGLGVLTDGVLTLTQDPENTMVGRVEWRDPTHFRFRLLEAPGDGPGLSFARSS